jgi:hypothetical protein
MTEKLTTEELEEMFGPNLPMEAWLLLATDDHGLTLPEIRSRLREIATAWNTRPSVDREAVDEDAIILAMCKAHDREEAAQMGEPSPWREDFDRDLDWEQGRFLAMREAFDEARALLSASTVEG